MELKGKKGDFDYAQSPKHLPENLRNPNGADRCLSGAEGSGYKQTEIGVIPEDWIVNKLGNECSFFNGLAHEQYESKFGKYTIVNSKFVSTEGNVARFSDHLIAPLKINDIAIVMSDIPNGKALAKCFLIDDNDRYTLNQRIGGIRFEKHCSSFFYAILNRNSYFLSFDSGSGQTNLRKREVLDCPIPIPPLPEQQKIAEALGDTDDLIQSLKKLIAKKKDIKQGAMQELLSGKRRLEGFDGEWENVKLGSIATFLKGKSLSKSQLIVNGKHKCIHYGELFTFYKETITEIKSRTDLPITENTFLSQNNDILMPTSDVTPNGLATASCINEEKVIIGGDVLVIRAHKQKLNGTFFSYIVSISKEKIMQLVSGSTVYHLYGSDMAKFEFNFPVEISEQTRIAQILSDMDAEIEALEKQLQKTELLKQGMMQELLTGRIRLIKPQAEKLEMVAEPKQNYKTHRP